MVVVGGSMLFLPVETPRISQSRFTSHWQLARPTAEAVFQRCRRHFPHGAQADSYSTCINTDQHPPLLEDSSESTLRFVNFFCKRSPIGL